MRDRIIAAGIAAGRTLAEAEAIVSDPDLVGATGIILTRVPWPTDRLPAEEDAQAILAPYIKAQRLADVRAQATALIQTNLPQPWDVLRHLATPEFIAWADDYLGLVAAELTRLETAIENDQEAIPDWPEVE
jgi:hypothetical protein